MEKTLFLHIGVGRTGSSALQVAIAKQSETLKSHGIHYLENAAVARARAGQTTSGNGMLLYCTLFPERNSDQQWSQENTRDVIDQYFAGYHRALVSSEYLAMLGPVGWERLKSVTGDYNIKIIVYVRNAVSSLISAYARHTDKGLFNGSVTDYVAHPRFGAYSSFNTLNSLIKVFEPKSCSVLHYETERADLFGALCRVLDLPSIDINLGIINKATTIVDVSPVDMAAIGEIYKDQVQWINDTFGGGEDIVSII